jgi:D-glycero-D-manno-heptose 1,7-bisphosphate phosphatase
MLPFKNIDPTWTLFLDRDGVINYEKQKDYIHTWEEFRFYEGVTDAMRIFAEKFKQIVIVTNQKGVGKGLTKAADLELIHTNMKAAVETAGGRIDAIYFCSDLDDASPNRKPNPGMGLQAAKDISAIDLMRSVMVGNTSSDMQFGRNIGAYTVFLPTTRPEVDLEDDRIDAVFPSLIAFAQAL